MPKKTTPAVSDLQALLEQSLTLKSHHVSDVSLKEYLKKSQLFLLRQWLKEDPEVTSLPDGTSILVALFRQSPDAALEWWQAKGAQAWSPTSGSPYPLRDVLSEIYRPSLSNKRENAFRWPAFWVDNPTVRQFIQDGLERAMPLREGDPQLQTKNLQLQDAWTAQGRVIKFLLEPCTLFDVKEKTDWLLKHRGLLLMEEHGNFPYWVQNDAFSPQTKVWHRQGFNSRQPAVQSTLFKAWESLDREPFAELVLPWLEKHGIDILAFQQNILTREIAGADDWGRIKKSVEAVPGAWSYQRTGHVRLLWQSCLCEHPEVLNALLASPPTLSVLQKTSDAGVGLWSSLMLGLERAKANGQTIAWPSLRNLEHLMEKVPLQLSSGDYREVPLLFRMREATPPWWEAFFNRTVGKAPEAWVGPTDNDQAAVASGLLVHLLVRQSTNGIQRERSAEQLVLLARAAKNHPEALTPQTHAVVWFAHKFLETDAHNLKADVSEVLTHPWPEPAAEHLDWIAPMMASIPKPSASHATLRSLQSLAKSARLSIALEQAPEQARPRL